MQYWVLMDKFSRKDQLIGIEVFIDEEHYLLRDHDRRFKLHALNKNKNDFLKTGKAVKREHDLELVNKFLRVYDDESREIVFRSRFKRKK